jgi:hypothetical protein
MNKNDTQPNTENDVRNPYNDHTGLFTDKQLSTLFYEKHVVERRPLRIIAIEWTGRLDQFGNVKRIIDGEIIKTNDIRKMFRLRLYLPPRLEAVKVPTRSPRISIPKNSNDRAAKIIVRHVFDPQGLINAIYYAIHKEEMKKTDTIERIMNAQRHYLFWDNNTEIALCGVRNFNYVTPVESKVTCDQCKLEIEKMKKYGK